MDENARKIFDEAYATLERVSGIEVRQQDYSKPDALEQWRRGMPPKPPAPTMAEIEEFVEGKLGMVLGGLCSGMERLKDQIGAAISHERKQHRDEIDKLRAEHDLRISALLAEVEKMQRGLGDRGEVIDLPNPLKARRG